MRGSWTPAWQVPPETSRPGCEWLAGRTFRVLIHSRHPQQSFREAAIAVNVLCSFLLHFLHTELRQNER